MNPLDTLARALSPGWALKRLQAKTQLEGLTRAREAFATRRYEGADRGRRTQGWITVDSSAEAATRGALSDLRARCRDLKRNNEWAGSAVRELVSNIAGRGVRPKFEHESDAELARVRELWFVWAESSTQSDASGRDKFYGLQAAAVESMVEGGECLIRRRVRRLEDPLAVPLQLQVFEGDHLDSFRDGELLEGGKRIVQGVQFDALGRREGYWVHPNHPGDTYYTGRPRDSVFLAAAGVSHLYRSDRLGQVRGVPWGAPTIMRLYDFGNYEDAEAVRMEVAASFAGFVQDLQADNSFRPGSAAVTGTDPRGKPIDEIPSGTIEYLAPGKTITFPNLPQNEGFPAYATVQLRGVAKGYGVPYWLLTGDLTGINFATIRADWVGFSRCLDVWRDRLLITHVCDPALSWWRDAAELAGLLETGEGASRLRWSWISPRREMLDPRTEVMAEIAAVRAGFKSISDVVQGLGNDTETVLKALAKDISTATKLGLVLSTDGHQPDPGKIGGVNSQAGTAKNGKKPDAGDDDEEEDRLAKDLVGRLQAEGLTLPEAIGALVAS